MYIFIRKRINIFTGCIYLPAICTNVAMQSGQVVADTTFQYMHVHNKKNGIMDISRNEAVHSHYIKLRIYIASEEQY